MANEQAETTSGASDGMMASARRMAAHLLELLQLRVELVSTEIEAEKLRLLSALSHGLAAVLLGIAGISMLSVTLLLLTPENWRWLSALGLSVLYFGLSLWFWWRARERMSQPGGVFAGTAAELKRDRESLEP